MASNHFVKQCEHGTIVTQCRCISPDKRIDIVPCPARCRQGRLEEKANNVAKNVAEGDSASGEESHLRT